MVVRQEHGGRWRQQRSPQRRNRGFGKPGHQPRIKPEKPVLSPIDQGRVTQMNHILVPGRVEPLLANRRAVRHGQTLVRIELFKQMLELWRSVTACGHDHGADFRDGPGTVQAAQQPAHLGGERALESHGQRLPLHRVENTEAGVTHHRGLTAVLGKVPEKRAVGTPSAPDVLPKPGP